MANDPFTIRIFVPDGEQGKYKLLFAEPAKPVGPIPYADAPSGSMQAPRYTSFKKLMTAKKLTDLFGLAS